MKRRRSPRNFKSLLLGTALLAVLSSAQGAGYYSTAPGPTVTMQVGRPTLVWRIFPEVDSAVLDAAMTINDVLVQPGFSREWGALTFTPAQPLPPGPYVVRCRVQVGNARAAVTQEKEWSFRVAENAVLSLPALNAQQREALDTANGLRRKLGLPLFRSDLRLCASSSAHCSYLKTNRVDGHDEVPGKPGFTGARPHERIQAFDYPSLSSSEDVIHQSPGTLVPAEAVQKLFDAPYHREPFLDPGLEDFGSGILEGYGTLNFGSLRPLYTGPPRILLYPLPGQKEIPTRFNGGEVPDPLRMHGVKAPTGYVISYFLFTAGTPVIQVAGAQLTKADGTPVPILLNTPANDDKLTNGAFLIPRDPLQPNTRYVATIQASSSGVNLSRTWSFTTGDDEGKPKPPASDKGQ